MSDARVRLRIPADAGGRVVIMDGDGAEIGFVDCGVWDGWLEVRWIEVKPEHRRWGLGVDAMRLLEVEAAERWGVKRVSAHVPVDVGLALYFWLRLGYRPSEVQTGDEGMIVVREIAGESGRSA